MDTVGAYNGYRNYPTWNVALWLDNDEALHNMVRELVEDCDDATELEERLESLVDETLVPDLGASMASDLFGWAMSYVDWAELSDGYWELFHDEDDEDEDGEES